MDWVEWEPFYRKISAQLGLDMGQDRRATAILDQLLANVDQKPVLQQMERLLKGRTVLVCGSGPSLAQQLDSIGGEIGGMVVMAADGATSAVLEKGIKCDIITTDLDGRTEDILTAVQEGAIPIVHAHGDNIRAVEDLVPLLSDPLGSTQVEPLEHVHLWGGFTDGDRACFIASHYSCKRVVLAGMDFGTTVGRWSKPGHSGHFPANERKQLKLTIAEGLITYLKSTTTTEFYNIP